jgi:hypothetical protein
LDVINAIILAIKLKIARVGNSSGGINKRRVLRKNAT